MRLGYFTGVILQVHTFLLPGEMLVSQTPTFGSMTMHSDAFYNICQINSRQPQQHKENRNQFVTRHGGRTAPPKLLTRRSNLEPVVSIPRSHGTVNQ